ncbi:MAG: hypothetical protein WCH05_03180 [Chlorobiaceae bacterium]
MGLANDMKSLSDEMLLSFKGRVKDNEELVANVSKKLQQFRNEQDKTAKNLKANAVALKNELAVGEKDRLGKYGQLMDSIQKDIKTIEKDVKTSKSSTNLLIKDFSKTRKILAADLEKFFSDENRSRRENEELRMADYEVFIGKLSDEVASIFSYTHEMLEKFDTEHTQMSAELRAELGRTRNERFNATHALLKSIQERIAQISSENLDAARKLRKNLNHGEAERMNDYNVLFSRISSEVAELRQSTASLLDNASKDRAEGARHWKQMQEKIAAIRRGEQVSTPKRVEKVVETPEVKVPVVAELSKGLPAFQEKTPEAAAVTAKVSEDSTLEGKILRYINNHIEGVKVSDMEEPLQESRMKIGFAAKCLLDAGKVSKLENLYYPAKNSFK